MRSFLTTLGLLAALLLATPSHAQFANHSLGLELGYLNFNNTESLGSTFFLGLDASFYIENGFEVVSLNKLMFPYDPITQTHVLGFAPSVGVRYLFLEEAFRPYVGVDLSYLHVFRGGGDSTDTTDSTTSATDSNYVGLGPNLGFEYFVADSISLGVRGQFNFYFSLNEAVQTTVMVSGLASVYF